jgi:hypothetical protein
VKESFFAVGFIAVATSIAWAQNEGSSNGPYYGRGPEFYYSGDSYAASPPGDAAHQGFDPTAHYWDYYRFDPDHGRDVDRATPP